MSERTFVFALLKQTPSSMIPNNGEDKTPNSE